MKKLSEFFKEKTEYVISIYALLAWLVLWGAGFLFGFGTYPVGYFQKLAFGILGIVIVILVAWFWLEKTFPELKMLLDPDNHEKLEKLTLWEKLKLGFWFFALFVGGAVVLASLY